MFNLFKSKSNEYKELKTACNNLNNFTYDVLNYEYIRKQSNNFDKCDKNNEFGFERDGMFDCIQNLKEKQDSFYTNFDYKTNGFQKGIKYFQQKRGGINKYIDLGEYKETKMVDGKTVSGGHGYSNTETSQYKAAIFERGLVYIDDGCDDCIFTLKDQPNISPSPPPSPVATGDITLQETIGGTRRRKTRRTKRSRRRTNRKARKSRRRR